MVDDPEGRANDFDERVPSEYKTPDEIADYMQDRFGGDDGVLPDAFIEQVAPHIAEMREAEAGPVGIATGSDAVWDPDAGAFRDPDTGRFVSPDDA